MIFLNLFDRLIKKKDVYFKFSTDEQWTGEYWIDGKKIYTKTLVASIQDFISGVNHGVSNIGSYRVFDLKNCFWIVSSSSYYPIPTYESSNAFIMPYIFNNTTVLLKVGTSWNSGKQSCYVTIRYTKTTD